MYMRGPARAQHTFMLQAAAGVGQTAVQQTGAAGQNYASNAGNAMMGGANALAARRGIVALIGRTEARVALGHADPDGLLARL